MAGKPKEELEAVVDAIVKRIASRLDPPPAPNESRLRILDRALEAGDAEADELCRAIRNLPKTLPGRGLKTQ